MSRRNSHFQKAVRREARKSDKDRAEFIHSASQEFPTRFRNRKERRGGN